MFESFLQNPRDYFNNLVKYVVSFYEGTNKTSPIFFMTSFLFITFITWLIYTVDIILNIIILIFITLLYPILNIFLWLNIYSIQIPIEPINNKYDFLSVYYLYYFTNNYPSENINFLMMNISYEFINFMAMIPVIFSWILSCIFIFSITITRIILFPCVWCEGKVKNKPSRQIPIYQGPISQPTIILENV